VQCWQVLHGSYKGPWGILVEDEAKAEDNAKDNADGEADGDADDEAEARRREW